MSVLPTLASLPVPEHFLGPATSGFVLVIDNYDSFTYNLVDLLRRYARVEVIRNDILTADAALSLQPAAIVISPGPGRPESSGICPEVLARAAGGIPVLGVCLGCQLIGQYAGATVGRASKPMHGKTSKIFHSHTGVFSGVPSPLEVMRYHSLLIQRSTLPEALEVTAWTSEGEIMGVRHSCMDIEGLQFHPESVLTPLGGSLIRNWLSRTGLFRPDKLTLQENGRIKKPFGLPGQ